MDTRKNKGISGAGLLVLVVFLFAVLWFTNMFENQSDRLTWSEFQTLVTGDNVDSISVIQNKNVPTGHVEIKLKKKDKDGKQVRYLYVSDINEVQDYLKENKLDYDMADVPQDTLFSTTILPVLLTLAGVMFIFMMMNRQGGNAGSKAMSFGKSRAKLSTDSDKKVTFDHVAGLKEEKEELEEIVDFLKEPKKYIQVGARIPKGVLLVGPPGTGKTTTLVEAIYETLHREPQVLVCAQSNTAVDWISEKLVDRGVNVLRIGNPTRVNDKMLSFTYERRFENHPLYPELWSIRKNLRELGSRARRGSYDEREGVRSRMSRLRDRATALEIQINAELFDGAHVIASTLVSSNHRLLNGRRFGTLFIDEAAQALEAACWIAIRKADRVVLAGDHCQLPPTIKCYEAARGGLERTLMEKVVSNKPAVVSLLKVQYRMHEEIMKFPSQWFYNGELEAAPEVRYRGILDWDTPIHWIDTSEMDFKEEFVGETFGRINKAEADLLLSELKIYINRIGGNRILEEKIDIGIISPYKAQVQYLRSKIKADASLKPYRSLFTVNTVDGFQGQERDVIFISLVRTNEEGQIGFLNDLRRMNVAITRARMKLVILGEAETLKHHGFYRRLLEFIQNIGNQ